MLIIILVFFFASVIGYNLNGIVVNTLLGVTFYLFIITNERIKKITLKRITKIYAAILSFSLIFYFLIVVLKIPFPCKEITFNKGQYYFNNYYVLLERTRGDLLFFARFNSLFLEPGQIGVIAVMLLAANNFEIKKIDNFLILICAICTLSLATYILLIFAIMYKNLKIGRVKYLLLILFILTVVYIYFVEKADGFFYERIIKRLMLNEGKLTGDNRVSSAFDYFYNEYMRTDKSIFGYGAYFDNLNLGDAAGYKAYLMQYGKVGTVLIIITYFFISFGKSRNSLLFFLIWLLAFVQAAYPLTPTQFILYVAGGEALLKKSSKKINNNKDIGKDNRCLVE
jgi:hypothetical protein